MKPRYVRVFVCLHVLASISRGATRSFEFTLLRLIMTRLDRISTILRLTADLHGRDVDELSRR